jgi:hypothetical protein
LATGEAALDSELVFEVGHVVESVEGIDAEVKPVPAPDIRTPII